MSATPRRKTTDDFDPEALRLFDQYVHGQIDRRGFLDRAACVAARSGIGAAALLAALSPDFALGQKVAPNDARIKAEFIEYPSPAGYGRVRAYGTRPARAAGPLPVVLVAHENRGLSPHIEDIARRLALDNFIALAPDALFPLGGYPGDEDKARELFGKLDQVKTREDFVASAAHARGIAGGNGKLGAVGFCYGGGVVNMLATRVPELAAGVPFYGDPAAPVDAGKIRCELLLIFADNDPRINAAWPPFEAALKTAGVRFQAHTYPGTQHGFNNDTTPRFDENAAKQAWGLTIAMFNRTLRS
jgi:carboxymethylenebutenolidase